MQILLLFKIMQIFEYYCLYAVVFKYPSGSLNVDTSKVLLGKSRNTDRHTNISISFFIKYSCLWYTQAHVIKYVICIINVKETVFKVMINCLSTWNVVLLWNASINVRNICFDTPKRASNTCQKTWLTFYGNIPWIKTEISLFKILEGDFSACV